jgi:hypothetical protein
MKKRFFLVALILSLSIMLCSETHLFQNFYRDAIIEDALFIKGHFQYTNTKFDVGPFEYEWSTMNIGFIGGYPVMQDLEIDVGLDFISISPDEGDGESGISDITVAGKYMFLISEQKVASGGYITLPVGSEDVGQGNLNFGFFGAGRMMLNDTVDLTATAGLDFFEVEEYNPNTGKTDTEYETGFVLGAGSVISIAEQIDLVPEFLMITEAEYSMLSCGVDYKLNQDSSIRGMFGFGMDDGSPDLLFRIAYLMGF